MRLFMLLLTFKLFLITPLFAEMASPPSMTFKVMVPRPSMTFKVPESKLDYSKTNNWYVYGRTNSLEKFIPNELSKYVKKEKKASVFYVHPTTYWGNDWNPKKESIPQERVKNLLIMNQAATFSACCHVYAPHYRQANIYSFWDINGNGGKAFGVAYQDIKDAFEEFIKITGDNPFILAGHSQGTANLRRLILELENKKKFRDNLIAAYLVGFNIQEDQFKNIQRCKSNNDTGCYLSWNTTMENTKPMFSDNGLACHNPLNWEDRKKITPFQDSKGSMPFKSYLYSKLIEEKDRKLIKIKGSTKCKNGNLFILNSALKRFPDRQLNLHSYDYAIFFKSILVNALDRVSAFHQ